MYRLLSSSTSFSDFMFSQSLSKELAKVDNIITIKEHTINAAHVQYKIANQQHNTLFN